jgi:hypothetical protein
MTMKKVMMIVTAVVFFAGVTLAQTPQTQDKTSKPAEKKEATKTTKSGCDDKTKSDCGKAKTSSGCCSKAKKPAEATKATPEKK